MVEALQREIAEARKLAGGRGLLAVNVMRAVSAYAALVRTSLATSAWLRRWALRRATSTAARAAFFIAALTVFATLFSIGWTRHPLGLWR